MTEEPLIKRYLGLDAAPSYLVADVDVLVSRLTARIQALEAELKDAETPLCEFCTRSDPSPMQVCCSCWNSANNDTWQRRAVAAEAERDALKRKNETLRNAWETSERDRAKLLRRLEP